MVDVRSDPQFKAFQTEDFDAANFASRALSGAQASAQSTTETLRRGISSLTQEIRKDVVQNQDELMLVVQKLSSAEGRTRGVHSVVQGFQAAVGQLKVALKEPCDQIRSKTKQLRNLRDTVELLRHMNHRLKVTQRLRSQVEGGDGGGGEVGDAAQAAKLLTEIEVAGQEVDLSGISILESDTEFLKVTAARIRVHADSVLRQGLGSLNQADVGNALQVYFNLEELPTAVASLMSKSITGIEHKAKIALDLRHALTGTAGGGSGGWQETFWTRIRELASEMEKSVVGIWHLQQVLGKKKDPISHVCFLDVVIKDGQETVLSTYWESMAKAFRNVVGNVVHPSKAAGVRDTLIQGFPALCGILEAMFERVKGQCQAKGISVIEESHTDLLLAACQPIRNAYLTASLARMSEAVSVAFPGGTRTLPSPPDVQKCIARMHEELKAAEGSVHAAALVAATVGKAVILVAERVQLMASAGSEVQTMGGACTTAQSRNITLCSHVQDVHRALVSVGPKLSGMAAQALAPSMDVLKEAAMSIAVPLFSAAVENLEQAILEIHAATNNWGEDDPSKRSRADGTTALPLYVKELEVKLLSFRNEYLMKFNPVPNPGVPSFTTSLVKRMACRVLVYFVRHAALIRPLGSIGRQQLARDLSTVQAAVGRCLFPVERLGAPFRILRAFHAMLSMDIGSIASGLILRDIPKIIVLHHLYSRAPPGLASPHTRTGLSPSQYSLWLDTHSAEAAVDGVKAALEACSAKSKGQPGFDEVFPVMMSLCNL